MDSSLSNYLKKLSDFMNEKANSTNVTRYRGLVSRQEREQMHRHKGKVLWFTGLSASGKSTIAHKVERLLYDIGCSTYVFDGDNVRHGLCGDLGFSDEDRVENVRRIGEMVHLFIDAGKIAITAFISPIKEDRDKVRALVGVENFVEIFVDCPVEVCIKRDPKGIYKKALAGDIKEFTGISSQYEAPDNPEIIIKSEIEDFDEAAQRIIDYLNKERVLFI